MKAQDLAQYIINNFERCVSNIELQKIMYFVVLKHYKDTGEYLLDEDFEAWLCGAIIHSVYTEYKNYGTSSIDKTDERIELEESIKNRIDFILSICFQYNYWDLVGMFHAKGGAWQTTYNTKQKGKILRELIQKEACNMDDDYISLVY